MNIQSTSNLDRCGSLQKLNNKYKSKLIDDISEIRESDFQMKQSNILNNASREQ